MQPIGSARRSLGRVGETRLNCADRARHATTCVLIKSGEPKSLVNARPCRQRPKRTFAEVMVEWAIPLSNLRSCCLHRKVCGGAKRRLVRLWHRIVIARIERTRKQQVRLLSPSENRLLRGTGQVACFLRNTFLKSCGEGCAPGISSLRLGTRRLM